MATLSFKARQENRLDDAVSKYHFVSTKIILLVSTFREKPRKSNLAQNQNLRTRRLKDAAVQAPPRDSWGCISNNAGAALPGTSGGAHRLGEARRAILYGNPAIRRALGYSPQEFKTLHVWNISPRTRSTGRLASRN